MKERDHMLSAYLDGELTAAEAAEFDKTLTPEERTRLESELQFEKGLGEVLSRDARCPEALWRRIQLQARNQSASPPRRRTHVTRWVGSVGAIAAALLLAFLIAQSMGNEAPFLRVAEASVNELSAQSEVPLEDLDAVQAFIDARNFHIDLRSRSVISHDLRHDIHLLGVCEDTFKKERLVRILFDCCGYPVVLVVAKEDGAVADELRRALAKGAGEVQSARVFNGCLAAVVGSHESPELFSFIEEQLAALLN